MKTWKQAFFELKRELDREARTTTAYEEALEWLYNRAHNIEQEVKAMERLEKKKK